MRAFVEGQPVILRMYRHQGITEKRAVITFVGRKYAYIPVQHGFDQAYDKETGWERGTNVRSNYKARLIADPAGDVQP